MDRVFYADLNGGSSHFRLKPAAAVISARRAGTTATWDQMNKYFGLMQMPIVTSQYWNMAHGACPEDVRQDLEGLQTMRTLGNNMAFFINCKNLGLKGIETAGRREPYTNEFYKIILNRGTLKPKGGKVPFLVSEKRRMRR